MPRRSRHAGRHGAAADHRRRHVGDRGMKRIDRAEIDRRDPEVRAAQAVAALERGQRRARAATGLALLALAAVAPFTAAPIIGDPGATVGSIAASVLLAGYAVAIWPWRWSDAEREHHTLAAIWDQARPDAGAETPWDRYAAWARAAEDRVELVLITRSASVTAASAASPFSAKIVQRLDPDAIVDAATAMERLRDATADLEARAQRRHADAVAAAARKRRRRRPAAGRRGRTGPATASGGRDAPRARRAASKRAARAGLRPGARAAPSLAQPVKVVRFAPHAARRTPRIVARVLAGRPAPSWTLRRELLGS